MKTHLNILLVDDDLAVLSVHARLLRRRCARVETATNGQDALECLGAETFDLVLCDIRMPGLDGVGVLRSAPEGTRIAFLTGYADYPKRQLLDEGAFEVLHKPARIDEVLGLIERVNAEVTTPRRLSARAGAPLGDGLRSGVRAPARTSDRTGRPSPRADDPRGRRPPRLRPPSMRGQRFRRSQSGLAAANSSQPVGNSSEGEA